MFETPDTHLDIEECNTDCTPAEKKQLNGISNGDDSVETHLYNTICTQPKAFVRLIPIR